MISETIPAKRLRVRLQRLHKSSGNGTSVAVWFAQVARVDPWTVHRWLSGARPFRGPALALLEHLEASSANGNKTL